MLKDKIIDGLFILAVIVVALMPRHGSSRDTILDIARYEDTGQGQINWEDNTFDSFILAAVQKDPGFDMVTYLKLPRRKDFTLPQLGLINDIVNKKFDYRFDTYDMWHAQSPLETIALESGDCKAYAVFKYHLLKQLGYTNVKIVVVRLPDGRGHIAGHALVLLNDFFVMDINHPYVYPYAYLRANNGLIKAYDETGAHLIKTEGEYYGEDTLRSHTGR